MEQMDSTYHVGDRVRIVGVKHCSFGENDHMRELVGKVRKIRKVFWAEEHACYAYYIDNDNHGSWTWDDSCFEPDKPPELPEFDTSGADVLSLFS